MCGLEVHYRERVLPSHPRMTPLGQGYRCRYDVRRLGVDWQVATLPLREKDSMFVVVDWDHPTAWVLLTVLRVLRRPYALWTDTPDLARRRHPLMARLRRA